jgi:hypothetical protein
MYLLDLSTESIFETWQAKLELPFGFPGLSVNKQATTSCPRALQDFTMLLILLHIMHESVILIDRKILTAALQDFWPMFELSRHVDPS